MSLRDIIGNVENKSNDPFARFGGQGFVHQQPRQQQQQEDGGFAARADAAANRKIREGLVAFLEILGTLDVEETKALVGAFCLGMETFTRELERKEMEGDLLDISKAIVSVLSSIPGENWELFERVVNRHRPK